MKKTLILAALVGLTACQTTTTSTGVSPTLGTTNGSIGPATATGSIPTTGPLDGIVTINGTPITGLARFTASGNYGGASIPAANGTTYDVLIFADDGKVSGTSTPYITTDVFGTSKDSQTGAFLQTANYARVNVSLLPIQGSADYVGDYRGTYGSPTGTISVSTQGGLIGVQGVLNMTADLTNKSISGSITSRQAVLVGAPGLAFSDVILNPVSYGNNGIYTGTTSGGSHSGNGTTAQTGTYTGVIGGNNGSNVGGVLEILSLGSTGGFSEVGAFSGLRQ